MQHRNMQYLDDLVNEYGQEAFIVQAQERILVIVSVVAQGMLNQEEHRLHQLRGLDEQSSKLRVSLERLKKEVEDGVQGHIDHIQLGTWIRKVEVSSHLFEDLS